MITTVIGAYPKPNYLKITDWFNASGGTDTANPTNLYEDEIRSFPHPRSLEAIDALAKWRGSTSGFRAAEAFVSIQTRWK